MASCTWNLWLDIARNPFDNMAIDELLLQRCQELASPVARFYGWDQAAASIGYFQHFSGSPHVSHTVVRRPTGGGTVFHDNDLTYTLVFPHSNPFVQLHRNDSYRVISEAVIAALESLGASAILADSDDHVHSIAQPELSRCFEAPVADDVMLNDRKVAGAAQRRNRYGLLHQGSIEMGPLRGLDRVTLRQALRSQFEEQFQCATVAFEPPESLFSDTDDLVNQKYGTDAWNRKR